MAPDSAVRRLGRLLIALAVGLVAAAIGWFLFVDAPDGDLAVLAGVALAVLTALGGIRLGRSVAESAFAPYNVAEVAVEGPITRDGGGSFPSVPVGTAADEVVELIERADRDGSVDALLLRLNTPGGQVVPSDDVRLAAERFDGPTVAYATDVCASGGYWIASGCDELFAREGSIVGSIGVVGSTFTATGLAEKLGLSYERFTAGKFKDAGVAFKEMTPAEREYLQGIVDDYYETFLERVTEGRDLTVEEVRDTEARVYLGEDALDLGLVDRLGTRRDVEDRLAERLGTSVEVRTFEPQRGIAGRIRSGVGVAAYALGAGVGSTLDGTPAFRFE